MGACGSKVPFTTRRCVGKPAKEQVEEEEAYTKHNNGTTTTTTTTQNVNKKNNGDVTSHNTTFSDDFPSDRCINSLDLYNILNDSGIRPHIQDPFNFLILDGRESEAFAQDHVVTAHQHAVFMGDTKRKEQLSKYSVIVLYGDVTKDDPVEEHEASNTLLDLMQRVEEYVACDVLVLNESYNVFAQRYSYLCTDQHTDSIDDRKLLLCYPSAIFEGCMYQGRGDQARNEIVMTTLGITHVVNISDHTNSFPHKIKYLRLPLDDMASTNLHTHFNDTYQFISEALDTDGCVFVHCNLGISRSSTITLAYLMKSRGWTLLYAYKFLKRIRTCASPNSGFLRQLLDWEAEVLGEKRTTLDDIAKVNHGYMVKR